MQVEVPVIAVGESPLVARGDALLNHALNTVEVEALPADIPQHIEVDISVLDAYDKSIQAGDIKVEGRYKILTPADTVLLSLSQTRVTAEEEAAEEAPAEPELIRKPRGDEEDEG